jgi:hypothetical protein
MTSLLGVNVTPKTHKYLEKLFELGVFEGANGNQTLHKDLVALVEAAHQVLAGGTASVQVTTPGNPQVFAELQTLVQDGAAETNQVNGQAGFAAAVLPP